MNKNRFSYTLEKATLDDLTAIVSLFSEDILGQTRESTPVPNDSYHQAFAEIYKDPKQELLVVKEGDEIIATLQLTFISNITLKGACRCLVEGVHVKSTHRNRGVGHWLFNQVFSKAKSRNCHFIQLTSNKIRKDAARFYESLGFTASHTGFKKNLNTEE